MLATPCCSLDCESWGYRPTAHISNFCCFCEGWKTFPAGSGCPGAHYITVMASRMWIMLTATHCNTVLQINHWQLWYSYPPKSVVQSHGSKPLVMAIACFHHTCDCWRRFKCFSAASVDSGRNPPGSPEVKKAQCTCKVWLFLGLSGDKRLDTLIRPHSVIDRCLIVPPCHPSPAPTHDLPKGFVALLNLAECSR